MGTTSKGLRYPEGTVLANTLHTRIKELADDANTQMTSRDSRMANIETPLAVRGVPLTRNASYTATISNVPNDETSSERCSWSKGSSSCPRMP